jgi:ABC-type antimicrobial peptide transport system permease subunit
VGGAFGDGCVEVVGIERGARYEGPFAEPSTTLYLSAHQVREGLEGLTIFVRTRGRPEAAIPDIRREVQALDPSMPHVAIEPLAARLRPSLIPWEVGAKLFTVLGGLATALAAVGLWMVVAFIGAQRTRELAVRAALGAGRGRLVGLVLLAGVRVSATGLAVGGAVGVAVAALFRNRLYGIGFLAPRVYVEVAALLAVVAALASLGPALRAASTRPAEVLKGE